MRAVIRFSEIGTFNDPLRHQSMKMELVFERIMQTICLVKTTPYCIFKNRESHTKF